LGIGVVESFSAFMTSAYNGDDRLPAVIPVLALAVDAPRFHEEEH